MAIKKLTLTNFRNHNFLDINSDARFVLIEGLNGSGKTNILEAVSFLSPGRGLHNANCKDAIPIHMAQSNEANWQINALVGSNDNLYNIGTGYLSLKESGRIIKVNDSVLSKQINLLDYLRVIWITPQIDNIFSESSSVKRKFFDRICLNFFPTHAQSVAKYEYAMRSRNKVLLNPSYDASWLNSLENIMAIECINIATIRIEVLKLLTQELEKFKTSFIKPLVKITGFVEEQMAITSTSQLKELLLEKFKNTRPLDAKVKKATIGTHTSQLEVYHPDKKLSVDFCSTGEKKAMLIALTIAQIMAIKNIFAGNIIVLLDDIFSHLDKQCKSEFIKELQSLNVQVWITATDINTEDINSNEYIKITL